jgi:hypothetical protein
MWVVATFRALRQEYAKPIFDDLEVWLKEQLGKISSKTPLAKAIKYALARLPKARPYLDHGFLELDNNTAERAVRPVAVGRKNYLFMEDEQSESRSLARMGAGTHPGPSSKPYQRSHAVGLSGHDRC